MRHIGGRPPSAADTHTAAVEEESETGLLGKRKGTPLLSFRPLGSITLRKTRSSQFEQLHKQQQQEPSARTTARSQHSGSSVRTASSSSDGSGIRSNSGRKVSRPEAHSTPCKPLPPLPPTSAYQKSSNDKEPSRNITPLVSAFADMSLTPNPNKPSTAQKKYTPSLDRIKEQKSPSKIPKFSCAPSLRHAQSTQALQTPPLLKHKSSANNGLRTPVATGARRNGATKGEDIPVFLTKEKLTPSLPAWDTKGRLDDMEHMFSYFRHQLDEAADSKSVADEALALNKTRGES